MKDQVISTPTTTLSESIKSILEPYYEDMLKDRIIKMINYAKNEDATYPENNGSCQIMLIEDLCYAINKPHEQYLNFVLKTEKTGKYEENLKVISFACSGGSEDEKEVEKFAPFLKNCKDLTTLPIETLRRETADYFRTKLDDFLLSPQWEIDSKDGKTITVKNPYVAIYRDAKLLTPTLSPTGSHNDSDDDIKKSPSNSPDAKSLNPLDAQNSTQIGAIK
jgi:hypothetical protein